MIRKHPRLNGCCQGLVDRSSSLDQSKEECNPPQYSAWAYKIECVGIDPIDWGSPGSNTTKGMRKGSRLFISCSEPWSRKPWPWKDTTGLDPVHSSD